MSRARLYTRCPRWLVLGCTLVALAVAMPESGWAKQSGGYSRPTTSVRTPSTGGYRRPGAATSGGGRLLGGATDRALARQAARQALDSFRAPTPSAPERAARRPSVAGGSTPAVTNVKIDLDLDEILPWLIATARTPSTRAPATPSAAATPVAVAPAASAFPWGAVLFILLLVAAGAFAVYAARRRQPDAPGTQRPGAHARPAGLRVGMTLPFDPAPFLLAAPVTAVRMPVAATTSGLLSVTALGALHSDTMTWWRLYLGDEGFFQIHLDARGQPDECRYFVPLDEVNPADAEEWAFWLGDEGLIGWPEFETQDGQRYQRLWAESARRIAPRVFEERVETGTGGAYRQRQQAMLYARPTGAAPPAPEREYLWVAAVEQDDQAWVALWVGIDIPCAVLAR